MITEATQTGNVQSILAQHRLLVTQRPRDENEIFRQTAANLRGIIDQDLSKTAYNIRMKIDEPLAFKIALLHHVRDEEVDRHKRLHNLANFVADPAANIKRRRRFRFWLPTIASVERLYGSGVSAIFHLQHGFFLINVLTLVVWLSLITIPYKVVTSSTTFSNRSFTFGSLFTSKGYLAESVLFQGAYPPGVINDKYDLSLIYFLTTYLYFIIWFVFITIRFAATYKQKVFHSILTTKMDVGFASIFARNDFTIQTSGRHRRCREMFQRLFSDLLDKDMHDGKTDPEYQTLGYKVKVVVGNLFYVVLAFVLGAANWMILGSCDQPTVDCAQSFVYLALINRLAPYAIAILTQIEQYKYLSYKLAAVGARCVLTNVCTILSLVIYFFVNAPACYETAFGQNIYILLLADMFASLVFPFVFGLLFDCLSSQKRRDYDGINLHVQLSPPMLLYSQFLIWVGIYFAPLLSIMVLLNIAFSFLSHRFYLFVRSRRSDSYKRVFVWNAYSLEYFIYLLAYFLLVVSATCFAVFTTQIQPSRTCGPFQHLNGSYEVMGNFVYGGYKGSALWISVINFLTSPGLIYFLGVTFFIVVYKLRHEGQAEKQLVFTRENNLESKKRLRQNVLQKLHRNDSQHHVHRRHTNRVVPQPLDVISEGF